MTATAAPVRDRDRQELLADVIAYDLDATGYCATPLGDGGLVVRYAHDTEDLGKIVLLADATIINATGAALAAAREYVTV